MSSYIDDLGNRLLPIEDRDFFSYDKDSNNRIYKRVGGSVSVNSKYGEYDEIAVTYPTTTTEAYTYKLNTIEIGVTTVTYTNASKSDLSGVVYNAS